MFGSEKGAKASEGFNTMTQKQSQSERSKSDAHDHNINIPPAQPSQRQAGEILPQRELHGCFCSAYLPKELHQVPQEDLEGQKELKKKDEGKVWTNSDFSRPQYRRYRTKNDKSE